MSDTFRFPPPPPPPPSTTTSKPPQFSELRGRGRGRGPRGRGRQPREYGQTNSNRVDIPGIGSQAINNANNFNSTQGGRFCNGNKRSRGSQSDHASRFNHSTDANQSRAWASSKPPRAKAEVPPKVPSFGSPILSTFSPPTSKAVPEDLHQNGDRGLTSTRKRKRITNQLGLTPRGDDDDDEIEEEDIDEEVRYASNASGPLEIEYEGRVSVLNTPDDIKAWIAERKKRWPTRARVEEKERVEAERQEQIKAKKREETQRLVNIKMAQDVERRKAREAEGEKLVSRSQKHESDTAPSQGVTAGPEKDNELEKQRLKLDKLRRKLDRHEAKLAKLSISKSKNQHDDAGGDMKKDMLVSQNGNPELARLDDSPLKSPTTIDPKLSHDKSEAHGKVKNLDSISSSSDEDSASSISEASSSSSSDDSDSDATEGGSNDAASLPDEISSKSQLPGTNHAPEESRAESTPKRKLGVCRAFRNHGRCKRGDSCWYSHDVSVSRGKLQNRDGKRHAESSIVPKRKSLYQRMMEKEVEDENRFALEVIKHLGQSGCFDTC